MNIFACIPSLDNDIGTLSFPLALRFGAQGAGFDRFIGFGVLIHNLAEFIILIYVWAGDPNSFYNKNVNFVFDNINNGLSKIEDKYISIIEFFLKNEMAYFEYDEAMTLEKQAKYMGEFYNWSNYQYFYNDFYK